MDICREDSSPRGDGWHDFPGTPFCFTNPLKTLMKTPFQEKYTYTDMHSTFHEMSSTTSELCIS